MIAELALGIPLAGVVGLSTWLTVKLVRATEHAAAVEVAQAHSEGEQTRLAFENETLRQQLDLEQRRADALQEVLNADSNPNADLPAGELRARLVRFAAATAARGASDADVPQDTTAPASSVADVLAGIATVR